MLIALNARITFLLMNLQNKKLKQADYLKKILILFFKIKLCKY